MSTRAYIGIKNANGTVEAIYNHSDGGLENLGHLLKKYFKTEDQVRELIDTGFISSIQDMETYRECKENFHSFNDTEWKNLNSVIGIKIHLMPVGENAETFNDIEEVMGCMICYAYLFIPEENKWYYTKGNGLKPLKA